MPFTDVPENEWYFDAVSFAYGEGLMKGMSETTFVPEGDLSRAMFVTIIGRFAGADEENFTPDTFSDTEKDTWYSPYVGWAVENGIVNGLGDNKFGPDDPMSRQEMATVISRYITSSKINMPRENTAPARFSDTDEVELWAEEHVEAMRRAGVINGSEGAFNPKDNITRAESAQIMKNLSEAEDKAWQGYIPDAEGESIILGAKYMYSAGPLVSGELGTNLLEGEGFTYPVLEAFEDGIEYSQLPSGTIGVSFNNIAHDFKTYPIVKICYKTENTSEEEPKLTFGINSIYTGTPSTLAKGEDEGFDTLTVSLADIIAGKEDIDNKTYLTQLFMLPFSESDGDDARLYIRYIGLFKNSEDADAFSSSDMEDYLKNYYLYSPVELKEISQAEIDSYNELITDRINEVLNSESEITPDMFDPVNTYYISSVNGDDSNDGKTPETAWKSLSKLSYTVAGGRVEKSTVPKGGAVFFERGSVFYPEIYNNNSKSTIKLWKGVSYGAYGEGDKPLFTGALDFTDQNNGTGNWEKT